MIRLDGAPAGKCEQGGSGHGYDRRLSFLLRTPRSVEVEFEPHTEAVKLAAK
jgi:hypothetical protein